MKQINFEDALSRLEQITQALENGETSLDESLKLFEEGIKLSRMCEKRLLGAEKKLEILNSTDIPDEMDGNDDKDELDDDSEPTAEQDDGVEFLF